jgi:hypothetical protein
VDQCLGLARVRDGSQSRRHLTSLVRALAKTGQRRQVDDLDARLPRELRDVISSAIPAGVRSRRAALDSVLAALRLLWVRNRTGRCPTTKTCRRRPDSSHGQTHHVREQPRWRIPSEPFQLESLNFATRSWLEVGDPVRVDPHPVVE